MKTVIQKTAEFLNKRLDSHEIDLLQKHLSFESMKANPSVNYENIVEINKSFKLIELNGQFMRSGKVQQGKGTMSDDIIDRFDRWTAKNLESSDLRLLFSSLNFTDCGKTNGH